MVISTVCEAITRRMCLELQYDGFFRVVEPHICGDDAGGRPILLAWQVRTSQRTDDKSGWVMLQLDETTDITLIGERAYAPRIGYRRDNPDFVLLHGRI